MILVFQLNKEYMIGFTQEPFDTNDEGGTEGQRDRVKFRDAIASKNGFIILYNKRAPELDKELRTPGS